MFFSRKKGYWSWETRDSSKAAGKPICKVVFIYFLYNFRHKQPERKVRSTDTDKKKLFFSAEA